MGNVTLFLYYVIHNYKGHFAVKASVSHSNPHFPKPSPGCPRFKLGTVEALATSSGLQPASESTVLHGGAGTCRHLPGSAMKVFLEFDFESQRSGYLFYLKKQMNQFHRQCHVSVRVLSSSTRPTPVCRQMMLGQYCNLRSRQLIVGLWLPSVTNSTNRRAMRRV